MGQGVSSGKWVVHKFGGTSVLNADRYVGVAAILKAEQRKNPSYPQAVVVSAMKGVTDDLIRSVEEARKNNPIYLDTIRAIKARHLEAANKLNLTNLLAVFDRDFGELEEVLRGVWLAKSASDAIIELLSGYGEIWSAQILAAHLSKNGTASAYVDARKILVVDSSGKRVIVDWEATSAKMAAFLKDVPPGLILSITGFVASTALDVPTTLKRNGSDYSASLFGRLLNAPEIIIWTDVDGVLSADPRLVPDAVVLSEMTYNEVTELANFGAKVVHPATMEPAIKSEIPVWIRNTFNPEFAGTKIHAKAVSTAVVKGFSAIEKMALINMEGTGLVGVSGVAERLFSALRSAEISVVLISQASSEHSICIAVAEGDAARAKEAIHKAFFAEIHQGALDRVEVTLGRSILAAVGDNMVEQPGVSGRFFSALGKAGINIDAIAQGASERNISAVIDGAQTSRALRAVHSAFYLSPQTIGIGLIGTGLIGREFLRQLRGELPALKSRYGMDIRVLGLRSSKEMLLGGRDGKGVDPSLWEGFGRGEVKTEPVDGAKWIESMNSTHLPHTVMIDATASGEIIRDYPQWLRAGSHIITPNKKANTQSWAEYENLRKISNETNRRFLYSTNVGAGLPLLQTLRDLYQTGDRLVRLEGVFSGTLSYIFNSFDGSKPFSEIVLEAKKRGYTEPDPRDDLSGMDVARKLVILAREAGNRLELSDIPVESLVPAELSDVSVDEYLRRIAEGDAAMNAKVKAANLNGEVLRYVGEMNEKGAASVKLMSFPKSHAFAGLSGADNSVAFHTVRYNRQPLVIQGPGAGPEVTAGGVFADLLRLASALGAPR